MTLCLCLCVSSLPKKWGVRNGKGRVVELDQTQEVTGNVERGDESMSEVTKPLTKF